MHTEVLLNPFYQATYVVEDDGQDYDVFTKLEEEEDEKGAVKNEIDAVEDIILEDFSFDDDDDDQG